MTGSKRMIMRIAALAAAVVMLASLCGCEAVLDALDNTGSQTVEVAPIVQQNASPSDDSLTLDGLIDRLNAQRWASNRLEYETEGYLPDYSSESFLADEFTDAEMTLLTTAPAQIPAQLTYEQATEDVEYLFRILRTSYGAYTFFGGDAAFNAAKNEILNTLYFYYPGGITVDDLRSLILDALYFVEDTHFDIDGEGTSFPERYYYTAELDDSVVIRRDAFGYYFEIENGVRYYVHSEDEQWFKMTIADNGELVYGLFALANSDEAQALPTNIRIGSTDGARGSIPAEWKKIECPYVYDEDPYTYQEIDGVPVISLDTYYLEESVLEEINSYINDAVALRDEEVIVVDLRYNTGGYDVLSEMWLYEFTEGEFIDWGIGYSAYISRLNEYVFNSNAEEVNALFEQLDFFERYPDYWDDDAEAETYEAGQVYEIELSSDMDRNDTTIFVLFNKHTYSAGELSLFQFENMENVVFVGTNSNGCLLTGGTNMDAPVWLPNSGMSVYYSVILVTSEIMQDFDSDGFQPDIIVDDDDAVQDVIDCWNYYNQE